MLALKTVLSKTGIRVSKPIYNVVSHWKRPPGSKRPIPKEQTASLDAQKTKDGPSQRYNVVDQKFLSKICY